MRREIAARRQNQPANSFLPPDGLESAKKKRGTFFQKWVNERFFPIYEPAIFLSQKGHPSLLTIYNQTIDFCSIIL
jgi:hypothetical protein